MKRAAPTTIRRALSKKALESMRDRVCAMALRLQVEWKFCLSQPRDAILDGFHADANVDRAVAFGKMEALLDLAKELDAEVRS